MAVRKAETGAVSLLTSMRRLPRPARERWSRDRIFFQIEELNAIWVQLNPRLSRATRAGRMVAAQKRAAAMRTAASWVPEATTVAARAYALARLDQPDDLFGPAFLLRALAPADPRTRALLDALPRSVLRVVDELSSP